ncbi:hypothetical protein [Butyrivibrio sp. AE2032]|uniref:hypothetical protein n=1 Tax=Butyrivibrio sp. AE2032 TaxID=1458463 RepID=UPI000AC23A43|nr:hypothetical protein [Butyrivibrio sp. AE2032]
MSNDYYDGMLKYEQICEEILVSLNISEDAKTFIQIKLLDEAQRKFESTLEKES